MGVQIIVDSTVDVGEEEKKKLRIIPLPVRFGDEEYLDGLTITHRQFYEKLIESDVLPTTSQATPGAFESLFREIAEAGDEAVVLTLASKLSGTYQSACIAAEGFPGKVFIVDSETATIASGVLAELALQLREEGLSAKEIADTLNREKCKVCIVALLDTLEYLQRGGRISKAAAFAGGVLSIKPVITIREGVISVLGKARGSRQGNNMLISEIDKAGGVDFSRPVLLGYTGLSDVLLQKYKEDSRALWEYSGKELRSTQIGSVIGTHAGPGAVAVAFFRR